MESVKFPWLRSIAALLTTASLAWSAALEACSYTGRVENLPLQSVLSVQADLGAKLDALRSGPHAETGEARPASSLTIDAHTHAFNACDFPQPASQFVRRFVGSRYGWAVSTLANLLTRVPACRSEPWQDNPTAGEGTPQTARRAILNRLLDRCDDAADSDIDRCTVIDYLQPTWGVLDDATRGTAPYDDTRTDQVVSMLRLYPQVDMFTPSLVDFHGFISSQTVDSSSLRRWAEDITLIADAVNSVLPGKIHPVAPYNPLRATGFPTCQDWGADGCRETPENPLYEKTYLADLVDRIEKQGFVGLKMYLPTGFKPIGNCPDLETELAVAHDTSPGEVLMWSPLVVNAEITLPAQIASVPADCPCLKEWNGSLSVEGDPKATAALRKRALVGCLVDRSLRALYEEAQARSIPIITHATPEGAALEPDYAWFARPEFWKPVLEAYPSLKVSFAHFGGVSFLDPSTAPSMWKGRRDERNRVLMASCLAWHPSRNSYWEYGYGEHCWWGRRIAELASGPLNNGRIFADISFDNVTDLTATWSRIAAITPALSRIKFMFGTDFPVLAQAHVGAIESTYTSHAGLASHGEHLDGYMGANAAAFFGLEEPQVVQRLCGYYANLKRTYPDARTPSWLPCQAAAEAPTVAPLPTPAVDASASPAQPGCGAVVARRVLE